MIDYHKEYGHLSGSNRAWQRHRGCSMIDNLRAVWLGAFRSNID